MTHHNDILQIYTLSCPLSGDVKYVGRSINPEARLIQHLTDKSSVKKYLWIRSLKQKGLKPVLQVIEESKRYEANLLETMYIGLFKSWGFDLFNHLWNTNETTKKIKIIDCEAQHKRQEGLKLKLKEFFPPLYKQATLIGIACDTYKEMLDGASVISERSLLKIERFIDKNSSKKHEL